MFCFVCCCGIAFSYYYRFHGVTEQPPQNVEKKKNASQQRFVRGPNMNFINISEFKQRVWRINSEKKRAWSRAHTHKKRMNAVNSASRLQKHIIECLFAFSSSVPHSLHFFLCLIRCTFMANNADLQSTAAIMNPFRIKEQHGLLNSKPTTDSGPHSRWHAIFTVAPTTSSI